MRKFYLSLLLAAGICTITSAQFTGFTGPTNAGAPGTTPPAGGIGTPFLLTDETNHFGQAKGVWSNATQSLAANFSVCAQMNFGRFNESGLPANTDQAAAPGKRTGADGIAFVMALAGAGFNNPSGNGIYVGETGEEMGYGTSFYAGGLPPDGFTPRNTIAVEFDTWQNHFPGVDGARDLGDPAADHMAFMRRGSASHLNVNGVNNTVTPVVSLPELETNTPWNVTISWNTATGLSVDLVNPAGPAVHHTMSTTVADVLAALGAANTNVLVNWGFNAGPGLAANNQTVTIVQCAVPCTLTVNASLDALSCDGPNVIYIGYGPQSVTATSNQAGTTFQWFMNGTPDVLVSTGATFTPTQPGSYYVVGTNGQCTASTEGTAAEITVIDIRCGKDNQNKVYVCHKLNGTNGNGTIGDNSHTLCVSVNAVPAHLAHGDCLGQCPNGNRPVAPATTLQEPDVPVQQTLGVFPNPSRGQVQVNLGIANPKSQIYIINSRGTIVESKAAGSAKSFTFDLKKYGAGVYMVKIVNGSSEQITKVIIQD
jgi:hypothetical protein